MRAVRPAHGLGCVLVPPQFLCVAYVQAHGDLIHILPGKDIEPVAHQGGRGITQTHLRLPLLSQLFRPGAGRLEPGYFSIPIGAAPLRPVLRENAVCTRQDHTSANDTG